MPDKDRAPQEWVEMSFCGMATHRAEFSHSLRQTFDGMPRRGASRVSQLQRQLRVRNLLVGEPCNGPSPALPPDDAAV